VVVQFILYCLAGFSGMEILSYIIHRFVFHGLLWRIHKSHHEPNTNDSPFEDNDIFSILFTVLALILMWVGKDSPLASIAFAVGTGISLYGILYFIIHDMFTHRRFLPFNSTSVILKVVRRAHQRHHQSISKDGNEPYGLFLFPYAEFRNPFTSRQNKENAISDKEVR
jgi:beta-carotene 3-hydroxylase